MKILIKVLDVVVGVVLVLLGVITSPLWVLFLIIILLSIPDDMYKEYDQHLLDDMHYTSPTDLQDHNNKK